MVKPSATVSFRITVFPLCNKITASRALTPGANTNSPARSGLPPARKRTPRRTTQGSEMTPARVRSSAMAATPAPRLIMTVAFQVSGPSRSKNATNHIAAAPTARPITTINTTVERRMRRMPPPWASQATALNTSEALVPPNPNEFESAALIGRSRGWCGTRSMSKLSNGLSRFRGGGAMPFLIARIE